jgi:hypothetical protein
VWEEVAYMHYKSGHYSTYIPLTAHGGGTVDTWFVWPAHAAPLDEPPAENFCIDARAAVVNSRGDYDPWWAHWGIVFGANEAFTNLYTFQVNQNKDWAVLRYPTYVYPGSRSTDNETKIIDWSNLDHPEIRTGPRYNTLRVVVNGSKAAFYVNGTKFRTYTIGAFPRDKIGLIAGDWEVTPVEIWVDYFRYDPDCSAAQLEIE